jgi:uncharacterized membrane protein
MALNIRRIVALLILVVALTPLGFAAHSNSGTRVHSHSRRTPSSTRKAHVSGHGEGHYAGGHGKNHKGGHYVNRRTGNRYRDRRAGVPR